MHSIRKLEARLAFWCCVCTAVFGSRRSGDCLFDTSANGTLAQRLVTCEQKTDTQCRSDALTSKALHDLTVYY